MGIIYHNYDIKQKLNANSHEVHVSIACEYSWLSHDIFKFNPIITVNHRITDRNLKHCSQALPSFVGWAVRLCGYHCVSIIEGFHCVGDHMNYSHTYLLTLGRMWSTESSQPDAVT